MERTSDQWIGMKPEAVVAGSEAQVLHCIKDARHDILELLCQVEALKRAVRWAFVDNDGECPADHPDQRDAFAALL